MPLEVTAPPPPPITMDDLLNSVEVLLRKEKDDRLSLESIGNIAYTDLKQSLVNWATANFPNMYEIYRIVIVPPNVCSDGVTRRIDDYIVYVSGKTMMEHVEVLAQKVSNMQMSFCYFGSYIAVVVSKN